MQPISVNKQSSIRLEGSKVLYFDPLEVKTRHDADYIFITHPHFDHFSLLSILELKKEGTVIITTKEVIVHTTNVSINTSKDPHKPCSTGCLVLLEAWTIGLVPQPASFEYTLLAIPVDITLDKVAPANPPTAALPLKAPLNIK